MIDRISLDYLGKREPGRVRFLACPVFFHITSPIIIKKGTDAKRKEKREKKTRILKIERDYNAAVEKRMVE